MSGSGRAQPASVVRLFVNGTLMRGEPLHDNLGSAVFCGVARTMPSYRLLSVRDLHPAMIPAAAGSGVSVTGELYDVSLPQLKQLLEGEPPGLGLGVVDLAEGAQSLGICWTAIEIPADATDISSHGGWREYLADRRASPPSP
jgi:adenine/guanine/hypoxanthine permease